MKKENRKVEKKTLTPVMREYVESCSDEHSLREKLYEDLSIAVKDEGFALYCYFTAIEVLRGQYEDLDDIQADLDSHIAQELEWKEEAQKELNKDMKVEKNKSQDKKMIGQDKI